jgi:hypothetical protein
MSKYVRDTDRQAGSMKTSTDDALFLPAASSSTEPLLVAEPTEEVGENKEPEDRLWEDDCDDDDDEEEEEENTVLKSARETASSTGMDVEVDDRVDVGVPQLRDYLSDRPAMSPLVDVREGPNAMKAATRSSSTPRVFEVREMMHDVLNDSHTVSNFIYIILNQPQFETVFETWVFITRCVINACQTPMDFAPVP